MKLSLGLGRQGFSLVGVMVAMGVSFIIIAALTSHMLSSARLINHLQSKMETVDLKQELALVLANTLQCNGSFGGLTVNVSGAPSGDTTDLTPVLSSSNPLQIVKNNYTLNNKYISITEFKLFKPLNKIDGTPNTASPFFFQIKLTVQEKGGMLLSYGVDGSSVFLNVTSGVVDAAPGACAGSGNALPQTNCYWTPAADWTSIANRCNPGYYSAGQQQTDCGNWHDCEQLYCCRSY